MRPLVLALCLAGCARGPRLTMSLSLSEPTAVELSASGERAFVDTSALEAWYYLASADGLGDNSVHPSATRITLTMLDDHVAIDSYVDGDLYFRTPGFAECERFTGTLDRSEGDDSWEIRIDATCPRLGYRVAGTLSGRLDAAP